MGFFLGCHTNTLASDHWLGQPDWKKTGVNLAKRFMADNGEILGSYGEICVDGCYNLSRSKENPPTISSEGLFLVGRQGLEPRTKGL